MKIAFIDEDLSPRTGSRRFTIEVTRQLQNLGHEVTIFAARLDREKCFREYLSMPIRVFDEVGSETAKTSPSVIKHALRRGARNPLIEIGNKVLHYARLGKLAMDMSAEIAESDFDVAMFHYHGEHWLSPYFFYLGKCAGVVFMNVVPPLPGARALAFQELKTPDRIVNGVLSLPPYCGWKMVSLENVGMLLFPSGYLLEQARRMGVIKNYKAEIVPLGVDHTRFHPTGEEEPFALYLGRINPHKSLELAILAMKGADSGTSLVIAGDIEREFAWYKEKLERLAYEVGVSERVRFVVSPSDAECVRLMQKCCIFVFPSTIDTFGLVVLEAMACGKPVVACKRGGVPEVLSDAGYLIEPDIQQWQKVVQLLFSDSELRHQTGKKSLERSSAFSWKHTTDHLCDAFSGLQ